MSTKVLRQSTHVIPRAYARSLEQLEALKRQAQSDLQAQKEAVQVEALKVYEQARARADQESATRWAEDFKKLIDLKAHILSESKQDVIRLAFGLCEKIMSITINREPEQFVHYVQSMIDGMQRAVWVHINVHPEHKVLLEQQLRSIGQTMSIKVIDNEALTPLDCIIETDIGGLDARFETQIQILRNALLKTDSVPEAAHKNGNEP